MSNFMKIYLAVLKLLHVIKWILHLVKLIAERTQKMVIGYLTVNAI
jgi:hypothetical protein